MISDTVFTDHLNKALKAQNITKKAREARIKLELEEPVIKRDSILEREEANARDHAKQKKDSAFVPSEFSEQCDFVAWFKRQYPDVVIMSIRNGGHRQTSERSAQLLEGLHPGAADLFIPAWLCWIEFKRIKGGVWSDEQKKFMEYVESIGQVYLLAYGAEDGKQQIHRFKLAYIGKNNILKK